MAEMFKVEDLLNAMDRISEDNAKYSSMPNPTCILPAVSVKQHYDVPDDEVIDGNVCMQLIDGAWTPRWPT